MNNVVLRALSGALYIALIVCSLLFRDLYFCILCMLFGIIAVVELDTLMARAVHKEDTHAEPTLTSMALDVFGIMALTLPAIALSLDMSFYGILIYSMAGLLLWGIYIVIRMLTTLYSTRGIPARELAYSFMGQVYLGLGLVSAQVLSLFSPGLVLLVFILIWINDTGAFLVGSAIGRRKLFPRLSPGKSWEGFFGGLFLGIAVSILLLFTGVTGRMAGYTGIGAWGLAFGLPITVGIAGTFGDLFESMLKRSVGAKDSGKLIPGHGGILDRIDSMLWAMPATLMFIFFYAICIR